MTVGSTYAPAKYTGNSSTLDFTYSFPIGVATYLEVYLEVISTGVQTLQTQGSDYTLVFDETGGTVSFVSAPTDLQYVIISRNVAFEQQVSLTTSKVFDPKVIEGALDKLTEQTQQLKEFDTRVPRLPLGSSITEVYLPTPSAGKAILWNATADNLENSTDDFNDIVTDAAAQAVIATTQAGIATTQAGLADTARAAAQTAQGLAETAQGLAEDAQDLAEEWASKTDGQVDSTDYSSKAYAIGGTGVTSAIGASKEWAITAEDTEVTTGNYSALHHAAKAAASALAAQVAKIEWQGTWSAGTYQANDAVEKDGTSWIATTTTSEEPSITATDWDVLALKGTDGTGSGDVSSSISSSTDGSVAVFDGTTGKLIKELTTALPVAKGGTGSTTQNFVDLTEAQTIAGIKTFSSFPVSPSSAPSSDYEVANKKYVDDNAGGGTIYGTCSTSGSTAAKTVSYSGFTLETGATINVLFSNANTATAPTLNVNSTGAKSIALEDGTTASSTYPAYFPASSIITFVYDGSKWRFKNNIVKNYVSGTSWYRTWADGFKEQGGRVAASSRDNPNESITISLAIAFSNTNYNVQSLVAISAANVYAYGSQLLSKSTSSMVIYHNNALANGLEWRAAGY